MDLAGAILTRHAVLQMNKRDINPKRVQAVLANPDEIAKEIADFIENYIPSLSP